MNRQKTDSVIFFHLGNRPRISPDRLVNLRNFGKKFLRLQKVLDSGDDLDMIGM